MTDNRPWHKLTWSKGELKIRMPSAMILLGALRVSHFQFSIRAVAGQHSLPESRFAKTLKHEFHISRRHTRHMSIIHKEVSIIKYDVYT